MPEPKRDIGEIFKDDELIASAMQAAVRDALRLHKAMDNPIAVWENDRVVWIQPEDIRIDDDEPNSTGN
jgi:hypothetical protein